MFARIQLLLLFYTVFVIVSCKLHYYGGDWRHYDGRYDYFSEKQRFETLEEVRQMFHFGYDNYMLHAFPKDELDPIHCTGRGPDYENP